MRIYSYKKQPLRRYYSLRKYISVFSIIGSITLFFILVNIFQSNTVISPVPVSAQYIQSLPKTNKTKPMKNPNELKQQILNELNSSIPEYSLLVEDFLSPFRLEMGSASSYIGASVHKLAIMVAIYHAVEKEEITLDQLVLFTETSRQDYGTGTLRYQPSGKTYTVQELLEFMIKKSDNTAAYLLTHDVLTMRDIQATINAFGLTETSMSENTTTNADMAILLRKLFAGQLFNASLTRNAISLLINSDFEDRLPALLPNNARVYHKIGTTIAGLHDVGVVITENSIYYIGIFTRGVSDEDRATKTIAKISRAVYDFMKEE